MTRLLRRSALALILAFAAIPLAFANYSYTDYSEDVLAAAEASGEPYLLDFYATWCTTCRAQERVVEGLYASDSKYNAIKVIRVDWDTYRRSQLVADLQIPRRSTLVLFKGETELGRIVAQTGEGEIRGLLDKAF
ncbi:thioredoxin family protein [Cucumibacter marinus]|uniref:thioredoxin family protein n=1 Tax=Cucumibacter marinus TaxID=1121252 RepID=UPI000403C563|nr:thioredoxin family protein [Cucumibacter marinus]